MNRLVLTAMLTQRGVVRYTPAGLPALDLVLRHESEVSEDGQPRKVSMDIKAVAIGQGITRQVGALKLGAAGSYAGFLTSGRNGREDIPLKTYRIPMLFYAPKHLAPGRVDTLTTQIDVAPTVLGLLGLPYSAPFFGEDVRHTAAKDRVAFFSHNHDVALYRDGELAILGLKKSVKNVRYDATTNSYSPAPADPALDSLAVAYYQTAYDMFREHRYVPTPPALARVHVAARGEH